MTLAHPHQSSWQPKTSFSNGKAAAWSRLHLCWALTRSIASSFYATLSSETSAWRSSQPYRLRQVQCSSYTCSVDSSTHGSLLLNMTYQGSLQSGKHTNGIYGLVVIFHSDKKWGTCKCIWHSSFMTINLIFFLKVGLHFCTNLLFCSVIQLYFTLQNYWSATYWNFYKAEENKKVKGYPLSQWDAMPRVIDKPDNVWMLQHPLVAKYTVNL